MPNAYAELENRFQRISRLDHAATFLQWDQLVMMPPAGNAARAQSLAELAAFRHELLTAPEIGELLASAEAQEEDRRRIDSLREMRRVWRQAACLPAALVKAKSLAGTRCEHGWRTQRRENDWPGFLENFEEVVRLSREEAQARQSAEPELFPTPYDAMLDLYAAGEDSEFIETVFEDLKQKLPEFLYRVRDRQPPGPGDLSGRYPVEEQIELNRRLMAHLGFDFEAGRLDVSMHPFSTGDRGDHRITTRFRGSEFLDALQATAHEAGHAAYEGGLPDRWEGLPVGQARSMAIHESQSLLFEKHLFLCRGFFDFFIRDIHAVLPSARRFGGDRIWDRAVFVRPGLIRIEADEVSYPLHVILRFEIERLLINGKLPASELPDAWDEKMRAYLGISTKDDFRNGCMQDIHWTDGAFGYFPTYTLGALNAAQFAAAVRRDHSDWEERLRRGETIFVRRWLEKNVWHKGSCLQTQELIDEATGEGTNPAHFLEHLAARYLDRRY